MLSSVPGVIGNIEFDENNWRDVLAGQYKELCDARRLPSENMGSSTQMRRIAMIMVKLAMQHGVEIYDMTEHFYNQRSSIETQHILDGGSGKQLTEKDFVTFEWRILEHYAALITPLAIATAQPKQPEIDTASTHEAIQASLPGEQTSGTDKFFF